MNDIENVSMVLSKTLDSLMDYAMIKKDLGLSITMFSEGMEHYNTAFDESVRKEKGHRLEKITSQTPNYYEISDFVLNHAKSQIFRRNEDKKTQNELFPDLEFYIYSLKKPVCVNDLCQDFSRILRDFKDKGYEDINYSDYVTYKRNSLMPTRYTDNWFGNEVDQDAEESYAYNSSEKSVNIFKKWVKDICDKLDILPNDVNSKIFTESYASGIKFAKENSKTYDGKFVISDDKRIFDIKTLEIHSPFDSRHYIKENDIMGILGKYGLRKDHQIPGIHGKALIELKKDRIIAKAKQAEERRLQSEKWKIENDKKLEEEKKVRDRMEELRITKLAEERLNPKKPLFSILETGDFHLETMF